MSPPHAVPRGEGARAPAGSLACASCHDRAVQQGSLIPRYGRARRDPSLAVLEGFHPLKHALRFDAELLDVVTVDPRALDRLAGQLAPDVRPRLGELARPVEEAVFAQLAPLAPATGVMAIAARRGNDPVAALAATRNSPIVLLEDP